MSDCPCLVPFLLDLQDSYYCICLRFTTQSHRSPAHWRGELMFRCSPPLHWIFLALSATLQLLHSLMVPTCYFSAAFLSVHRVGYRQEDVYLPTSTMRMTFSHPKSISVNAASADSAHMIYTCLSKCCPFSLLLMRHRSPGVSFVIHLSGFFMGWV